MSEMFNEFDENEFQDFWSPFAGTETFVLPDGKQTIIFKIMNEGDRMAYQRKTSRDIKIDRRDGGAALSPDLAGDRLTLITMSVVDWTLRQKTADGWRPVVFNKAMLENWVKVANPKIITELERAIQKANPWMRADMTPEDIDEEIKNLEELKADLLREREGK